MDRSRRPDVAFVPYTRWPVDRPLHSTNEWDVFPELFVEVVSPNDLVDELETKVEEYLQAGGRLVWVVYPRHRRVYVFEPGRPVRRLTRADDLDAEPVLPGFRLPLVELFPKPPAAQP